MLVMYGRKRSQTVKNLKTLSGRCPSRKLLLVIKPLHKGRALTTVSWGFLDRILRATFHFYFAGIIFGPAHKLPSQCNTKPEPELLFWVTSSSKYDQNAFFCLPSHSFEGHMPHNNGFSFPPHLLNKLDGGVSDNPGPTHLPHLWIFAQIQKNYNYHQF